MIFKKLNFVFLFVFINILNLQSQVVNKTYLFFDSNPENTISGNSVTDLKYYQGNLWLASGGGLSRTNDNGVTWYNFGEKDFLSKGGISAITFYGETVWISTAFDTIVPEGNLPAGGGLSYSNDLGTTWNYIPQPGVTNVQNVTFDIAVLDSTIWTASWGGGLKRSDDWGKTWKDAPPDTFFFDPLLRLNHRAFSVIAVDSVLWVGTAGGINRSADNGQNWVNFRHQNQDQPISGNFVVALAHQAWKDRNILWAATIQAEDPSEFRAVSFTEDEGQTWHVVLDGEFAHNFDFDYSVVYVPTDNGLFKSIDFGKTWDVVNEVRDKETNEPILTTEFFSAEVTSGHLLWAGTSDGLVQSDDGGTRWKIFRTFETLSDNQNISETYAYPNPFSPIRHNQFNDDGHVRFHYQVDQDGPVNVKVYDFDMTLVCEVENGIFREGGKEYDAIWNGKNDYNEKVANGVYYYKVDLPGGKAVWGKVIVLD